MHVFTVHSLYFSPSEYVLADSGFTAKNLCVPLFTIPARLIILLYTSVFSGLATPKPEGRVASSSRLA